MQGLHFHGLLSYVIFKSKSLLSVQKWHLKQRSPPTSLTSLINSFSKFWLNFRPADFHLVSEAADRRSCERLLALKMAQKGSSACLSLWFAILSAFVRPLVEQGGVGAVGPCRVMGKWKESFHISLGYHRFIIDIPTNFSFNQWKRVFSGIMNWSNDPENVQLSYLYRLESWLARHSTAPWEKDISRLSSRPLGTQGKAPSYLELHREKELGVQGVQGFSLQLSVISLLTNVTSKGGSPRWWGVQLQLVQCFAASC